MADATSGTATTAPQLAATDFALMISSDLIAVVMERYFNDDMFKRPVTIVDLKSAEDGYVFSLAFQDDDDKVSAAPVTFMYTPEVNGAELARDSKGKFTSRPRGRPRKSISPASGEEQELPDLSEL